MISRTASLPPLLAILCISVISPASHSDDRQGVAAPSSASWEQLQKAGSDSFYNARYGDAERQLKQAVIKGASFGEGDLRFAQSLGELGRLYTVRGRFSDAEPLLEEEYHAKLTSYGDGNPQIIPAMGSLIKFYLAYGTAIKAPPITEDLLTVVTGKLRDHSSQNKGSTSFQIGQPLTASAATAAPAARDPLLEWAITCDSVGDAYRLHRDYDLAEKLYKAALDVKTTVLGPEHLSLANSYDSLGSLSLDKNDDTNAEYYFKDALDMTARILQPGNPQIYTRLDKLAKCYIKEKKFDQAEKLYLSAQDFWKDAPSHNGGEARAKYSLGSVYVEEKDYAKAAPVLEQALQLAEQYYGDQSISLVPYLQRYADALFFLGQKDEVTQLRSKANSIAGAGSVQ